MSPIPCLTGSTASQQFKISSKVAETIKKLPTTLADLVAQYADEGSYAEMLFEVDSNCDITNSETNQKIKSTIRNILTSDGELARKRIIFENLGFVINKPGNYGGQIRLLPVNLKLLTRHRQAVKSLLDATRADGLQINLDHVDFSDMTLTALDLTGASAVGARFNSTTLRSLIWKQGDFTGALFQNTTVAVCDFSDALLYKSVWANSKITSTWLRRANLAKISMFKVTFQLVMANQIQVDDRRFKALTQVDICTRSELHFCPEYDRLDVAGKFFLERFYNEEQVTRATVLLGEFSSS